MLDKCQRKPQLSLLGLFKFLTSSAHAFLSGLGDFFFSFVFHLNCVIVIVMLFPFIL